MTREQVIKRQEKAVRFCLNVLKDEDKAAEIQDLSPEEYAARKRLTISNPAFTIISVTGGNTMAATKAELEQLVDEVQGILEEAYHPESSREQLAEAVGDALDKIEEALGEAEQEDEEEDEGDEDQFEENPEG